MSIRTTAIVSAIILASLPAAHAQRFVSDSVSASCENCYKKTVELGKWQYCALSAVRQGGPNSSCGVSWSSDGWSLVLRDPINDPANPHPQTCRVSCFSIDQPAGNMTRRETIETPNSVSSPPVSMPPSSASGGDVLRASYKTTYGIWNPEYRGNGEYYGTYPEDNGRIFGTAANHQFDGYWAETSSSRRCSSSKDGTYYWGRLVMAFDSTYSAFEGKYGYCDDTPSRKWDGTAN